MMSAMVRRFGLTVGVSLLLVVVGVAASLSSTQVTRVPVPRPAVSADLFGPAPSGTAAERTATAVPSRRPLLTIPLPRWMDTVAGVLCSLVFVGIAGFVAWQLLRGKRVRSGLIDPEQAAGPATRRHEEVIAALDAGLSDLADDGDPRRAVIACWLRLERAAAAAGTPRHLGDAPGELVTRLLAEHRVSSALLAHLADLYREARYGTHMIDDRMRSQAQAALSGLRAELTASATVATSKPTAVAPAPRQGAPS